MNPQKRHHKFHEVATALYGRSGSDAQHAGMALPAEAAIVRADAIPGWEPCIT